MKQIMSLARIVHHSRALCLVRTSSSSEHDLQHYVPPFKVLPQNQSLVLPSRGDNPIPPNPRNVRTVWLFGHAKFAHKF